MCCVRVVAVPRVVCAMTFSVTCVKTNSAGSALTMLGIAIPVLQMLLILQTVSAAQPFTGMAQLRPVIPAVEGVMHALRRSSHTAPNVVLLTFQYKELVTPFALQVDVIQLMTLCFTYNLIPFKTLLQTLSLPFQS